MFNWLFKNKQDVESKEITEEVKVQCACDFNNNENCDLITKLRDLQKIEKDLKKEIKALERDSDELIFNFLGFLKSLEKDDLNGVTQAAVEAAYKRTLELKR